LQHCFFLYDAIAADEVARSRHATTLVLGLLRSKSRATAV